MGAASCATNLESCLLESRRRRRRRKPPTPAWGGAVKGGARWLGGAVGYREDAAEREDRAVRVRRIRRADPLAVLGEEVGGCVRVQHGQRRPEARTHVPLE